MGYLKDGKITGIDNGWYDTGDIVDVDENGFVTILGRAKRFAKIGGEMVSLTAVENVINNFLNEIPSAVVSVPDEKKGEQLILVTEKENLDLKNMLEYFKEKQYSELWVPKKVIYTEALPLLGTGKIDYVKIKEIALNS